MQFRTMCKSKIHRAKITKKELHYEGSIGVDKTLMEASGIYQNEFVQVLNVNNGARFETYVIEEQKGSGTISLYGPAAHLGEVVSPTAESIVSCKSPSEVSHVSIGCLSSIYQTASSVSLVSVQDVGATAPPLHRL